MTEGKETEAIVSIRKCDSYKHAERVIMEITEELNVSAIFKNKRILLKVNLMLSDIPEKAINTHPEFVRAVIKVCKKMGGNTIYVGESSGAYGFTKEAFRISGIEKVASEEDAHILNFDALPLAKENIGGEIVKEIYLPKILKDIDVFISLPKLKTHRLMLYTGALKNQIGLIPGCEKVKVHLLSKNTEQLARAITDLNYHIKFNLAYMDGIIGMEGNGPTSGNPIRSNFIAGSRDLVALDSVCCHFIGIEPSRVPTNVIGTQRNLGISSLNEIKIRSDFQEIKVVHFKFPQSKIDLQKSSIYNKIYFKLRAKIVRPYPLRELCKNCQLCNKLCPTGAIQSGFFRINKNRCIRCFVCYENCPYGAIKLKCPWFLKSFLKRKLKAFSLNNLI